MEQNELEKIAEEFKGRVSYKTEEQDGGNVLSYLFYNDSFSSITARDDAKREYAKIIAYQIRCIKVRDYLEPLNGLKNNLSGRVLDVLKNRNYGDKKDCTSTENLILDVKDFKDLADLIKLHLKLANPQSSTSIS